MNDTNTKIMEEVLDEVDSALKDSRGLIIHQRRIAFLLSLGNICLLENYLKKNNVFKIGARINHEWLKKKKENVKLLISNQITCPIENIKNIDEILDICYKIEEDRNLQAYGKSFSEESLMKKINLFFSLKEMLK